MKKYCTIIALFSVVCLGLAVGCSEDKNVAAELEAVVMKNFKATEAKDVNTMLETLHTQSPSYAHTKNESTALFEEFDIKYELLQFQYVGMDGEYAIARCKYSAKKIAGGNFKENRLDTFQIFREENGSWKMWSMTILRVETIY